MQPRNLGIALVLVLSLSGCASGGVPGGALFRAFWPGGVNAADDEWCGRKSGEVKPVLGFLAPEGAAASAVSDALADPVLGILGVMLPVTPIGESSPRWIWCNGDGIVPTSCKFCPAYCRAVPLGAEVCFAGKLVPGADVWRPKRVTADPFND